MVDVRSFTVTHLAEPEEIIIPDYSTVEQQQPIVATPATSRRPAAKSYRDPNKISKVSAAGKKSPILVAPDPNKSTKLKNPASLKTRAINRAAMSNRKQVKPRQNGMFKRFTLLIVDFLKERFVWARRKSDTIDADHDKRIAENYVYDEVLGVNVLRSEFEKRAKFNSTQKSPQTEFDIDASDKDEFTRFPSRLRKKNTSQYAHNDAPLQTASKLTTTSKLRPPKFP